MLDILAATIRRSPALLTALGLLTAGSAWSQTPFDITDPNSRSVRVFVDNNSTDPSSVGLNLAEAYTGSWSDAGGGVGVITVSAQDAFDAALASADLQGTPIQPQNWTPVVYRIDRTTGHMLSLTAGGWINSSALGDTPFGAELNTLTLDPLFCPTPLNYNTSGFSDFDLGGGTIIPNAWCTDSSDIFARPGGCPVNGPAPFPYNAATGRLNAIGPVLVASAFPGDVCSGLPVYASFGDIQLFELAPAVPPVPTLGSAWAWWAVMTLAPVGLCLLRGRRARSA